tara:strand:+ start:896 stop:1048 length:153 start_codon:yes stop_codon:yes gene_type:complete
MTVASTLIRITVRLVSRMAAVALVHENMQEGTRQQDQKGQQSKQVCAVLP